MRTSDFDFELPPDLIAQTPSGVRDESRMLVLHRKSGKLEHRVFRDLPEYLRPSDLLVLNNSRVIPARLYGRNMRTGGSFEMLLLEQNAANDWWAMMRPGKRARPGTRVQLVALDGQLAPIHATVIGTNEEGHRRLRFSGTEDILVMIDSLGEVPLPPYIRREGRRSVPEDRLRYQTVYAELPGSVAAPTAGLHFTTGLLDRLSRCGVEVRYLTLHVGLGTFAPVKTEVIGQHLMHEERYQIGEETARAVNEARRQGRRVVAVGTTTTRVLESVAAQSTSALRSGPGKTRIFIHPPHDFKVVDIMLTNFHLPRSTLLMLVSAFAAPGGTRGIDTIRAAYREAILARYRFFSYGDAMLLL
jgi:S-adenosylmethionine:tRNA ribosyltransferase-isomerase